MLPSSDRPAVNNLFRPSLLAWRAKYLADNAKLPEAPANKPATATQAKLPRRPAPRV
jgi:hypothetical protein